jgi:hypothetical protein
MNFRALSKLWSFAYLLRNKWTGRVPIKIHHEMAAEVHIHREYTRRSTARISSSHNSNFSIYT